MNVWGYWKCPYCGEVVRADHKDCTKCGASIPNDVKFFMDTDKPVEYVDEAQESDEANWLCSFCRSQNPAEKDHCENCGAKRSDALGDYFTKPEKPTNEPEAPAKKKLSSKTRKRLILLGAVILVILFFVWLFKPVTRTGEITGFEWERSIGVEEYQRVKESGWSVPGGAELVSSNREVRSYRQVLDHYEYKTKRVAKRVQDGYKVEYKDLGNGQFKEVKKPKYKTVYENERVKTPVYRQEPIYDTKYYYNIDKWKQIRSLDTQGSDHEPKWAETDLPTSVSAPKYGDRRQGAKTEKYYAVIKDHNGSTQKIEYGFAEWEKLKTGDKVEYKTLRFSDDPL